MAVVGTSTSRQILAGLVATFWMVSSAGARAAEPAPLPVQAHIRLVAKVPRGPDINGHVELRPYRSEGENLTVAVENAQVAPAALPAGSAWLATPKIPGYWGRPVLIEARQEASLSRVAIELEALGKLSGRFVVPRGEALPRRLEIRLVSSPKTLRSRRPPRGSLTCPVGKDGSWVCEVPAAEVSVMISAEGYIPLYRWSLAVEPWQERALGKLPLRRGASLSGWVEVAGGEIDSKTIRARLFRRVASGTGTLERTAIEGAAFEAPVRTSGFFQFAGIPTGSYELVVEQAAWAPARVRPILIETDEPVLLGEPVLLEPTLTLELRVSPARDWLDRPWSVAVRRPAEAGLDSPPAPVFAGQSPEDGLITLPGQSPGVFRVTVSDSLGNKLANEEWVVTGPISATREVAVEVVPIRGTVSLGEEPLAATLHFGGRFGALRMEVETDARGAFAGVLPRAGRWRVDVEAFEPPVDTRVHAEVENRQGQVVTLEIRVPDTEVFGRVVDAGGSGVAGANVSAMTSESVIRVSTSADGRFRFRGLPEGRSVLSAEVARAPRDVVSRPVAVEALTRVAVGPVELRLSETTELFGMAVSPGGPVPGAAIQLRAAEVWMWETTSTDLEGRYRATLPATAERVHAVIAAPGYGLRTVEMPVPQGPLDLFLSREQGGLRLSLPVASEEVERSSLALTVFQEGVLLPFPVLTRWAESHGVRVQAGEPLSFPGLAPGHYRACLSRRPAVLPWELSAWMAANGGCDEGFLTPGGELHLDLPELPGASEGP